MNPTPTPSGSSPVSAPSQRNDIGPLAGAVGDIRLLHRLGRGGMSTVHLGFHLKLERFVAVKLLFPEVAAEPKAKARFIQEGTVYSRLRHPNIAAFVESGERDDGSPYLALEYVQGTSLSELIAQVGRVPPGDVLEFLEDLTKALDHAHGKGVIHRDIKPQNLIVNQDSILKLIDFGIAQLSGTTGISTQTGQVLATYMYAAPEQNQGKEIDRTADLYAMGAMAWEMLVGRRFITGSSPPQIVLQQTMGPPPPPSEQVEGLPSEFDEVVRKLCMPYPEDRYRSASEVAQALRQVRRSVQTTDDVMTYYGDEIHEKWVLAKNAYNNGQLSLASSLTKYIVKRKDDFAPAHFLLGKLFADRELPFNASDSFRRALDLDPDNEGYLLDFTLALYRMGRYSEALQELENLREVNPTMPLALGFRGVIEEQFEATKKAELTVTDDAPLWFDAGDDPFEPGDEDLDPLAKNSETPPSLPEVPPDPQPTPGEPISPPSSRDSRPTSTGGTPLPSGPVRPSSAASRAASTASSPEFPEVDLARMRRFSRIMPGLAQLYLEAPKKGWGMIGAAVALGVGLAWLVTWSPVSSQQQVVRAFLGMAVAWGLYNLWQSSSEDANWRARRLHLRGSVTEDVPELGTRLSIGVARGVKTGQVFEIQRDGRVVGEVWVEDSGPYESAGRFHPAPNRNDRPQAGDSIRFVRDTQ